MALRHAAFFIAVPLILAFGVSSPGEPAFWIVLATTIVVLLPVAAVLAWFYREIRRARAAVDRRTDAG
jgi:hypothetical protein